MARTEGGGRGPYTSLIGELRRLLGSLYDDSPGSDKDEAALNMARLQIIAPPSASERERIADATPDELQPWFEYTLMNQGGRSMTPGEMEWGGVTQNFNDLYSGIQARVRDDNIDRTTIQQIINAREEVDSAGDGPPAMPSPPQSERVSISTPSPAPASGGSGGSGGGGGTSGGGGDIWSTQDDSLPADGTGRQIPGGEELWRTDDGKVYLAYENPEAPGLWMIWHVESPERLQAIYGDAGKPYDREMTTDELKKMSPWYGGLAAELQNTSEEPWGQFNSDFKEAAKLRPWLNDPTMQAVMMGAYLEGRAPTQDELSQTDWWNEHTADERAWLEQSVTLGREELARRRGDQIMKVGEALRQAGVNNAPRELIKYIAEQSLTGKWSEQYLTQQIRRIADPMAPGRIDAGVKDILDGVDLDPTRQYESEVRSMMEEWLGPDLGRFDDRDVAKWAGRLRRDPDATAELEDTLRQQRKAILPEYADNLTYRQIIAPVENLATQVWGQPVQDSAFLVDLANTMDYTQMAQRLRSEGRKRGVRKVVEDALTGLGQTALGEQVVQSAV